MAFDTETKAFANGWDAALRVAMALVAPKALKADADALDRLAHTVSTLDAKAIQSLVGHPEFVAVPSRTLAAAMTAIVEANDASKGDDK